MSQLASRPLQAAVEYLEVPEAPATSAQRIGTSVGSMATPSDSD
jgi:hypothetical protein